MSLASALRPDPGPDPRRRPPGRPAGPSAEVQPLYFLAAYLRVRRNMTVPDVAAELQVSERTVKRLMASAREVDGAAGDKLRQILANPKPPRPWPSSSSRASS